MAIRTRDIVTGFESLPVGKKTKLIEKLLRCLHPSQKDIDALWAKEAERRLKEIKTGKVRAIPGADVFKEVQRRFS